MDNIVAKPPVRPCLSVVVNSGLSLRITLPIFFLLVSVFALTPAISLADVPQPEGYRMELYDDAVPAGLDGATRVTAVEVKRLQETANAVVVDVIPEHRKPDYLPENQIWIPVPHRGVPGAIWLPDTGFGVLSDVTESYFKRHISDATQGKLDHPIIFYCRIDCWMSWNAAKRALSYGYTNVYWFADGIEDWQFEGFEFAILTAAEGQRQVEPNEN
ncbi:MAG: PQQ-dependent catabolism-associated CXXCW motif protein [Granulosicoccus sp.]|nr:PQQ-dependent catabolism-associated CXXCW motif protein [Granulosicoccus sp.]